MSGPVERRRSDRGPGQHSFLETKLPVAVLQAPFQFAVALASASLGIGIVLTAVLGIAGITAIQTAIPMLLALAWGSFLAVGGTGTTFAMLIRDRRPEWSVIVETTSLMLLGTGWLIYAVAPIFGVGLFAPLITGLCVSLACAVRVRAIVIAARVMRDLEALRQEVR